MAEDDDSTEYTEMPGDSRTIEAVKPRSCIQTARAMNRNVLLNLVLAVASGLADNMWGGTVLVAYLFDISGGSNTQVGMTTAVQGITNLVTSLPAGYFADKHSRSAVIKVGALVQLLFMSGMYVAVLYGEDYMDDTSQFYIICASLGMNGFANGIIMGPAQALLADSLETGFREKYYNWLFVLYLVSSCVGPLVCIGLFQYHGDNWGLAELRTLLLLGITLELFSVVAMCMFRDDAALGDESEALRDMAKSPASSEADEDDESSGLLTGSEDFENVLEKRSASPASRSSSSSSTSPASRKLTKRAIPYILFGSDLVISLASGCTVQFFPLFFKNDCNMSPTSVQAIYVVVPLVMACFSTVGTRISARCGSVQTVLGLRVCGLCLFGSMIALYRMGFATGGWKWFIVLSYVLRTAVMNATYPIEESILMDNVPKKERARWKSLESISSLGWCGSAFLGGWLADKYSYTFTFVITIVAQSLATAFYSLLLPLVEKRPAKSDV